MATQPLPDILKPQAEPKGMDDNELASLLAGHEAQAIGYFNDQIAAEQSRAIDYYYGKIDDLPALEGCSSVVDHTVAVMVDNGLAAVLKPFVSADEVVSFEPRGPEDVPLAEQATEYVNYVIQCDNPGFLIFHDWFKDAMLTKIGVVKCWWEDTSRATVKKLPVDAMSLMRARQDQSYIDEEDMGGGMYLAHMQQMETDGRVKLANVPPEEFLISPLARSIEEAAYVAHRPANFTRSDLIEFGADPEVVEGLSAFSTGAVEESRVQARYRDEQPITASQPGMSGDKSRDIIAVIDEYVKVDYDGDGISELRRVVRVEDTILLNEPVDEVPFALICPCPMPHKVYGRSVADQALEGQKVRTAVTRQTLDNLYKTNNPRPIVPETAIGKATMDDILDSSPGAIIRPKVPGQLDWGVVPFSAQHSFAMLEAVARDVEEQTGIQRKGQGFNAEALKKNSPDTATQAAIDENSRNERAEMIARIFAETGVKRLFKLILNLLQAHQPRARIIRLRNKFVEMDPRGWPEMDLSISVGLGMGNKAEQIAQASTVLEAMERIGQTPFASLINAEHARNALKRLYVASGIKNVDDFLGEVPKDEQGNPIPPQTPPDPKMVEAQARMQIEQMKLQAGQAQAQAKIQIEQAKAQAKLQIEQAQASAKAQLEAARLQLDQMKADFEARLAMKESEQQFAIERAKLMMARENNAERASIDREKATSKERPGGKLNK